MANKIDIKIGSDIKGFKKGVASVKSRLKSLAGSAAGMMGVGLGVAGITMGIKKLVDNGDRIGKVSKRLGVTAEFYQKLSFAAERSGASQGAAEKGIKKMQATIFDAGTGLKTYIRYFDELGINYKDLEGKSPEKQFKIISAALNGVTDATKKSALAQKIFGRAGIELIPMLKDYNDLAQELEDRGAIITNENIKAAEDFKDAMTNIGTAIQASLMNSGLMTWLADIIDQMDAVHKLKKALSQAKKDGATGEYTKESSFWDKTVDATADFGKNNFGNNWFGKALEYTSPLGLGAKGIRAMGGGGSRDTGKAPLIVLPPTSKKEVTTAKSTRIAAKQAAAEAEAKRKAAIAAAAVEAAATKALKAEEKAAVKQKAFLDDMKQKIKIQAMINAGKEKEARIQNKIHQAEKRGIKLTPEAIADIKKLDDLEHAKDKDKSDIDSPQTVAPIRSDRLARIGGTIGNARSVINQADVKRNTLLEKIAKNTEQNKITINGGAKWT